MNLQSLKLVCESLVLLALAGSAGYVAWDLHQTQTEARYALVQFEHVESGTYATLDDINKPCAPGPCGTLAEIGKATVKLQDISVTTQKQVQQSATLINSATSAIQSAAGDVHTLTGKASELTVQATTDLRTANDTIAAGKPLLASLTRAGDSSTLAVQHFDALMQSKDLTQAIHGGAETSTNLAGITDDFHKETTKLFNPPPCETRKCRAGRIMGAVGGYLSLAAEAASTRTLISPLSVKIQK